MLKNLLSNPKQTNQVSLAILFLRIGLAFLIIHGYDKLQQFIAGNYDFPDPLHLSPKFSQGLTIFAEFFCSIFILFGFFTRFSLIPLIICMLVIAFGLDGSIQDKEHPLLYLFGYISLYITGSGKYSMDEKLGINRIS